MLQVALQLTVLSLVVKLPLMRATEPSPPSIVPLVCASS
jgi:hypothetical protein